MQKIAIIIEGNPQKARGQVNASLSRIKNLKRISENLKIDVFCLITTSTLLFNLFHGGERLKRIDIMEVDGISLKMLWKTWYLIDYLLYVKLHKNKFFARKELDKYVNLFSDYDLISAHSDGPASIAFKAHVKYNIPYCVTWHGSDIHTLPFNNSSEKKKVVVEIENAEVNFFVSKALLECSNKLTPKGNKMVLYNGVDKEFCQYPIDVIEKIKKKYNINGEKVVGFVGNLFEIKNAALLPDIFNSIISHYSKPIKFWIIGDGNQRIEIEEKLSNLNIDCTLMGNQPKTIMPELMNCIDVLVLPSKNEGLPLVVLEALSCGTHVVASDVGGISEVIGQEMVVNLNTSTFVDRIGRKVTDLLVSDVPVPILDKKFSWEETARIERLVYSKILGE